MSDKKISSGVAALAICESLLISLVEDGVISKEKQNSLIEDAIAALRQARLNSGTPSIYVESEAILERILSNRNGVRST